MTTTESTTTDAVVEITESAREKILSLREGEEDAVQLGLRIEIIGARGMDFTYDLAFMLVTEAEEDDVVFDGEIPLVLPEGDVDNLRGAVLDIPSNPNQGGLVLRNPNRPPVPEPENIELSGDIPDQVRQLLDQVINPAIASHGGFAEFVGLEGNTVYVRLGGGCQGCSLSSATVTAGIEQTLKEHIPTLDRVVDVTDHEQGDNPYY
ncbi:MAG: NifU family protein [Acidimicrobiales bacterium]